MEKELEEEEKRKEKSLQWLVDMREIREGDDDVDLGVVAMVICMCVFEGEGEIEEMKSVIYFYELLNLSLT